MCQAKITDHYSNKYKCNRENSKKYNVSITYNKGYRKGIVSKFTRILCNKHAKIFRYNCNRKRNKGHTVIINEIQLDG